LVRKTMAGIRRTLLTLPSQPAADVLGVEEHLSRDWR
jgi:hypothetical protein